MDNKCEYDKINGDVFFIEESHKYGNIKMPWLEYISVTTIIDKYFEDFDKDFWSSYKAIERIVGEDVFKTMSIKKMLLNIKKWKDDYLNLIDIDKDSFLSTKNEILEEYRVNNLEACERGTAYHLKRELAMYDNPNEQIKPYIKADINFECEKNNWDLNRENAILPEYLIYYSSPDGLLNIAGQVDLVIKEGNDIQIYDYKGLPLDTPIATEFGWKLLKDLTKKDRIFDKDGNLTKILNISNIHYNPCYEIKFDNGESIIADHEHKWLISFMNNNRNKKFLNRIMTTEEIANWIEERPRNSHSIPKILNNKSLVLPEKELPIDPYVFGAWLGDGSKSCGIVTNVNVNFWNEIKNRGYEISNNLSGENRAEMRTIYGLRTKLRLLNVINNKHIPDVYLRSSHKQRLDLLRGLMDTDGYYNKTRNRFVMSTNQKWQARDTANLVSSLGWKPTIIKSKKICTNNGVESDGWDVCFFVDENPFLIRNQDIVLKQKEDRHSYRNITSVKNVEIVPTKCLEVDSKSHTFLAGYSLIVTHNTNRKGIDKKAYFDKQTKSTKKMFYPINNIPDTTFNHYALQLSFYAYMLKQINPEFNIKQLKIIHDAGDGETEHIVPYLDNDVKKIIDNLYSKKTIERERDILSQIAN